MPFALLNVTLLCVSPERNHKRSQAMYRRTKNNNREDGSSGARAGAVEVVEATGVVAAEEPPATKRKPATTRRKRTPASKAKATPEGIPDELTVDLQGLRH